MCMKSFFRDPDVTSNLRKMEAGVWVPLGMSCHPESFWSLKVENWSHLLNIYRQIPAECFWLVCVSFCVYCRQACGVCSGGGGAMHCSVHGPLWPNLLLRNPEALWWRSEMLSWCLPWLWWTQTGDSSLHASACILFVHTGSVQVFLCFSRCCRKKTPITTM